MEKKKLCFFFLCDLFRKITVGNVSYQMYVVTKIYLYCILTIMISIFVRFTHTKIKNIPWGLQSPSSAQTHSPQNSFTMEFFVFC